MDTLIQNFERAVWEVRYTTPSPDQMQIRENRIGSNAAIAAHDTAGIAKYWSGDILVLTSRNAQNIGKRNHAQAFNTEFKTKQEVTYVRTPDRVDVSYLGNMASETGPWVGKWKDGNDHVKVNGTFYAKWIKTDSRRLIRAEIHTAVTVKGDSIV